MGGMNKKQVMDYVHKNIGREFPVDCIFMPLLQKHPNAQDKLKKGIKGFKITPNAIRKQYGQVNVIALDGSLVSFSVKHCFRAKTDDNRVAFRAAIATQMLDARQPVCERCGEPTEHVHHNPPAFEYLFTVFTNKYGLPESLDVEMGTNRTILYPNVYRSKWELFHSLNASLSSLCLSCHRKAHQELKAQRGASGVAIGSV